MSKTSERKGRHRRYRTSQRYYWAMMLPGLLLVTVFDYVPMLGVLMAFQNYVPAKGIWGSAFVGLKHFRSMLSIPDCWESFRNTLVISLGKMLGIMFVAISFAILLNEIKHVRLKKVTQTIVYLPHFISWVVLAAVVKNILGLDGMLNYFLNLVGLEPLNFMGSNALFQPMLIGTYIWKEFGYSSVIYLAALTSVDPGLHEAAAIDGAGWWRRVWHVTLPGILPVVLVMAAMDIASILSAGFDQVYNLYTPLVYEIGDIIDTYVYRVGLLGLQYSFGAAVGLLKSVVGMILMLSMNEFAKKFANRRIF